MEQARLIDDLAIIFREQARYADAEALLRKGLEIPALASTPLHSTLLSRLGTIIASLERLQEAAVYMDEALRVGELHLSEEQLGFALSERGILAFAMRDLDTAQAYLNKAYQLQKAHPKRRAFVNTVSNLGRVFLYRGDFTRAFQYFQQAADLLAPIEQSGFGMKLVLDYYLGEYFFVRGAYSTARTHYTQALEQVVSLKLPRWIFWCHLRNSQIASRKGEIALAQDDLHQAGRQTAERALPGSRVQWLRAQGELALGQNDLPAADDLLQEALEQVRALQDPTLLCDILLLLGTVRLRAGNQESVRCLLQEGSALAQQLQMPRLQGEASLAWGEYALFQEEYDQAREEFTTLLRTIPHEFQELMARAHAGLAQVALACADAQEALKQGKAALALFEGMGHVQASNLRDFLRRLSPGF